MAAGDQVSLIIDQAILQGRFVEISLASGKSYVGSPIQGTFGHRDDGDVAIIPVASGYRNNETQALVMTTNYAPTIDGLTGGQRQAFLSLATIRIFVFGTPIRTAVRWS